MKHLLTTLLTALCIALASALHAASPAATQAWVSNYVENAISDLGVEKTTLPTNVVAGEIDVDAGTLTFTEDGVTYTYPIAVTSFPASVSAFVVTKSSDTNAVPVGTILAQDDSTGLYVNRTLPFPAEFIHTITNGCDHLDLSNGVWYADSCGMTNVTHVCIESNLVFMFDFEASKIVVTRAEAESAGVTNAAQTAWAPVRRDILDILLGAFVPAAYADTVQTAGRATSFEYVISLPVGEKTMVSKVVFYYAGDTFDWNLYPPKGYPKASDEAVYVPSEWAYPGGDHWNNEDNWVADGTGDKIYVTSWKPVGNEYVETVVAVKRSQLVKKGGKTISDCIPPFVAPTLVTLSNNDRCNRGDHYLVHCACRYCDHTQNHDLVAVSGHPEWCHQCQNWQGRASHHLSDLCGSTKKRGGSNRRSLQRYHMGWHDGDDVEGDMMTCKCQCGDWEIVHDPSGEIVDVGEGYYDVYTQATTQKDAYHHYAAGANVPYDFINVDGECYKRGYCNNIGPDRVRDDYCNTLVTNAADHSLYDLGGTNYVSFDDAQHYAKHKCQHELDSRDLDHVGCGFVTNILESHSYTNVGFIYIDGDTHACLENCLKCDLWHTNLQTLALHSPMEPYKAVAGKVGATLLTHDLYYRCDVCKVPFEPSLTNAILVDYCKGTGDLVLGSGDCDWRRCECWSSGCTNLVPVDHDWFSDNSSFHWCQNGNGHKREPHGFSSKPTFMREAAYDSGTVTSNDIIEVGSGICYTCGWVADNIYKECQGIERCESCACYHKENFRERYFTFRNGETYVTKWEKSNFPAGGHQCRYWNGTGCGCYKCDPRNGVPVPKVCECSSASGYIYLCDAYMDAFSHRGEWFGSTVVGLDGSDPVYEVGENAFELAVACCPDLHTICFPYVTNVQSKAFLCAATNCPTLRMVDFSSLECACSNAFDHAFEGSVRLERANFSSLVEIGGQAFDGAFRNSGIGALAFPCLTTVSEPPVDFFDGAACGTLTNLTLPKLTTIRDVTTLRRNLLDFGDMPNLEFIDLSGASTNVINRIGDLSNLSKLKRIDFSEVTGIPSYLGSDGSRHAPASNETYLVVVPDALCAAWRASPGWSGIANHIVPCSNQVVETCTVSFDTGTYGEQISNVVVFKGAPYTAPASALKFAPSLGGYDDGGYAFNGWYVKDAGSSQTRFVDGSAVESNMTLVAKWTDNRFISVGRIVFCDTDGVVDVSIHYFHCGLSESALPTYAKLDVVMLNDPVGYEISYTLENPTCDTYWLHFPIVTSPGYSADDPRIARLSIYAPDGSCVTNDWVEVSRSY